MASSLPSSDTRAQPRRRKDSHEQPIFLRKTFQMVSSAPVDVCCWSSQGDTFIVKDPEIFAAQVIPQFFKHNNFSSFVRQLNFYGFRKVKSDTILNTQYENKWWEFRHEKFQKGKPHLLSEIKRATHYGTGPDQHEVEELKTEVSSLRHRIQHMNESIQELTDLVNELVLDKKPSESAFVPAEKEENPKKRKVSPNPPIYVKTEPNPELSSQQYFADAMFDATSMEGTSELSDGELMMDLHDAKSTVFGTSQYMQPWRNEQPFSAGATQMTDLFPDNGVDGLEDDVVDELLRNMDFDVPVDTFDSPMEAPPMDMPVAMAAAPTNTFTPSSELQECLALLPKEMQDRFIEKLVEAVMTSSLANTPNPNSNPTIAIPLASAALGAFLTQYAHTHTPTPTHVQRTDSFQDVHQQC